MGFELLQPFLEAVFAFVGLTLFAVGGIMLLASLVLVIYWGLDKAEDFADRMEASWNVKA